MGRNVNLQALLIEVLLSGFFAVACFRARAGSLDLHGLAPRSLFRLTDRLDRLRRSRWQWFSIVLLLVVVRLLRGTPLVAELTALAQFIVFLVLPAEKSSVSEVLQKS